MLLSDGYDIIEIIIYPASVFFFILFYFVLVVRYVVNWTWSLYSCFVSYCSAAAKCHRIHLSIKLELFGYVCLCRNISTCSLIALYAKAVYKRLKMHMVNTDSLLLLVIELSLPCMQGMSHHYLGLIKHNYGIVATPVNVCSILSVGSNSQLVFSWSDVLKEYNCSNTFVTNRVVV